MITEESGKSSRSALWLALRWASVSTQATLHHSLISRAASLTDCLRSFLCTAVPDLLAKNWRSAMQGHNAHYCALAALLCFGAPGPFLPGTGLIVLVNIPEFFRVDLGGMLKGSSYGEMMHVLAGNKIFSRSIGAAEVGVSTPDDNYTSRVWF